MKGRHDSWLLMQISWIILLPAAVVLLLPLDRLLPAYMKCRTSDALTDPAAKHRRGWWRWQPELWLDVLRVGGAVWFVAMALEAETVTARWIGTGVLGAILAVGACLQMPTRREHDCVLAPVTYVFGAMLALLPVGAALAVFTLAVAAMLAFRSYNAFFLCGVLLTSGLSYLLAGDHQMGLVLTVVQIVVLLAAVVMEGELVLPLRDRRKAKKTPVQVR